MKAYTTNNKIKGELAPLKLIDVSKPTIRADEVLVEVKACGINRSDIFLRMGLYPLRSEDSKIIGSEVSGVIVEIGEEVKDFKIGDKIFAATEKGDGYSEYVALPEYVLFEKPENLSYAEATSLPIAMFTCWHNIFRMGGFKASDKLFIHGGTSGMGVFAIQLAKSIGAKVYASAGTKEHCNFAEMLGADNCINYRKENFESLNSYDVIFDILGGGEYFKRNVEALNNKGVLRIISFIEGAKTSNNIYLGNMYNKGGQVKVSKDNLKDMLNNNFEQSIDFFDLVSPVKSNKDYIEIGGDTIRRASKEEKEIMASEIRTNILPLIESGKIKPVIDKIFSFKQADCAHKYLLKDSSEGGGHIGKIVLTLEN